MIITLIMIFLMMMITRGCTKKNASIQIAMMHFVWRALYDDVDEQEGKSVDRIVLNEAAAGGIYGSKLSPDEDELEVVPIMMTMI